MVLVILGNEGRRGGAKGCVRRGSAQNPVYLSDVVRQSGTQHGAPKRGQTEALTPIRVAKKRKHAA